MGGSFHALAGFSTKKSKKAPLDAIARKASWFLLLLITGGLVLARWRWGDSFEPRTLVAQLRGLGSEAGAVPLFIALYIVGTSLFLPAVGFGIVAVVIWGHLPGLAVSLFSLNLVASAHFGLGRWLGRDRVEAWLVRRGWHGAALRGGGISTMIAVRQIPLPFVAVNVAAGASPISWHHFAIGSAIGSLPSALIYTWVAIALIDGVEGARGEALIKALAGAAVVFAVVVGPRAWRWARQRRR